MSILVYSKAQFAGSHLPGALPARYWQRQYQYACCLMLMRKDVALPVRQELVELQLMKDNSAAVQLQRSLLLKIQLGFGVVGKTLMFGS